MQFLNFMDMIDGGGAGQSGDTFEGGGLLSMLGNALFKPVGYRERMSTSQAPQSVQRAPRPAQPQPTGQISMDELMRVFAAAPQPITQQTLPPMVQPVQPPQEWGQPGSTVDPLTFLRRLGYPI